MIIGPQYCLGDSDGCAVLRQRSRAGVQIKIMLDQKQQTTPSCHTQHARLQGLKDSGIRIRSHKPSAAAGRYASLQAKAWVCDGLVYMGGSANFTGKSMTNNIENLVIAKSENVVSSYLEWFEAMWAIAEEI